MNKNRSTNRMRDKTVQTQIGQTNIQTERKHPDDITATYDWPKRQTDKRIDKYIKDIYHRADRRAIKQNDKHTI